VEDRISDILIVIHLVVPWVSHLYAYIIALSPHISTKKDIEAWKKEKKNN